MQKLPAPENAEAVTAYLRQMGVRAGDILVDIGSGGTTQLLLERLLGVQLHGLQLSADERLRSRFDETRTEVFLFGGQPAPRLYWAGQPMLERLISEDVGATLGYRAAEDKIEAVAVSQPVAPLLAGIQQGVRNFAVAWRDSVLHDWPIPPERAIAPFLQLVESPTALQVKLLGDLTVEDGGVYPLAAPESAAHYLAHPRDVKRDLAEARWKIGFLKRLAPLPLPYGKIYLKLKNNRERRDTMAKISVILPAYNAEKTLCTAVESILSQQVPGMEIIIVNDGSADGTARLCHVLASENDCIHVITQKNAGICAARNRGLEAAGGEFIAFCDDDDLFWQGALKLLLQTAEDSHADIVRGGYELLRQRQDGTFAEQRHPTGQPCTIELGKGGYGAFLENSGPQFVWNALYRRTALLGLRFNERCSFGLEDFVFNAAAYRRICKAVYIPQVVYRHFEGAQSTSCARTAQALMGRIRALEPWMEAEFHAAQRWCSPDEMQAVWKTAAPRP